MTNYDLLLTKLDAFIRKFYLNKVIKGSLLLLACLLAVLLILFLGEYLLYFPAWVKLTLLALIGGAALLALWVWILVPLLRMQKLGPRLSHEDAAGVIGAHFPSVSDKLLNILQLQSRGSDGASRELIRASIEQKAAAMAPIPMLSAISLRKNRKYLPYVGLGLLLFIGLVIAAPATFRNVSGRWLRANENFTPPAPFSFELLNKEMVALSNTPFVVHVRVQGKKIPQRLFLNVAGKELEMTPQGRNRFSYTFARVSQPIRFYFTAAGYDSRSFEIHLVEKPQLTRFEMALSFPSYTGMIDKKLLSLSDITVPEGTRISWSLEASHTRNISYWFSGDTTVRRMFQKSRSGIWQHTLKILQDTSVVIALAGDPGVAQEPFRQQITVIPDLAPQVAAERFADSVSGQQVLLKGQATDDYGLRVLFFHYEVSGAEGQTVARKKIRLPVRPGKITDYHYYFDIGALNLTPGQRIEYFVEAWDNDEVNGSKRGQSIHFAYQEPATPQLDSALQQNLQQMQQNIAQSARHSAALNQEITEAQTQILTGESTDWEQQQMLDQMRQQHQTISRQVDALKKRLALQQRRAEERSFSDRLQQQQRRAEQQLEQLQSDELSRQLEKLKEMLARKDKGGALDKMNEIRQENKLFRMNLEQLEAMIKKLEQQMQLEALAKKVEALTDDQKALQEKTGSPAESTAALKQSQQNLKEQLEKLMNEDLRAATEPGEKSPALDHAGLQGDSARTAMQQSAEQLGQQDRGDAQQAQESATEQLQKMSASLMEAASGTNIQQIEMDIRAVRQLLSNLIRYSFAQEQLIAEEKAVALSSPQFKTFVQRQHNLRQNAAMIRDSLAALGKRVFQLAPVINRETVKWTDYVSSSVTALENRRVGEAGVQQQFAMATANNLALLLNETLENLIQMQAQAQSGGKGGGTRPKPGKSGKGTAGQQMKDIITGQQAVGAGMKSARSAQQGQTPGEGQSAGQAQRFAELARQQAALRRQLQDLASLLNSEGGAGGENAALLRDIQQEMNRNETDLVNRRLHSDLFVRQKKILSRMLQASKAIREQEEDNKRMARQGKDLPRPMPPELKQHLESPKPLFQQYQTEPATLNPFYKKMTNAYWKQIAQ